MNENLKEACLVLLANGYTVRQLATSLKLSPLLLYHWQSQTPRPPAKGFAKRNAGACMVKIAETDTDDSQLREQPLPTPAPKQPTAVPFPVPASSPCKSTTENAASDQPTPLVAATIVNFKRR